MKIRRLALLCICCASAWPANAGVISGITVGLDGSEPLANVAISARRIGQTGIRENNVFKRTVSGPDGRFAIDVGNTPVVELLFENGPRIKTYLQRLGGLNDMPGLVVVAPFSLVEEQPSCEPVWFDSCGRPLAVRRYAPPQVARQTPRPVTPKVAPKQPVNVNRQWTNTAGRKVTAVLVKVDGTKAFFQRPNGERATATLAELSAADQSYIKSWLAAKRVAFRK